MENTPATHRSTLVLNADYMPLWVVNSKRALVSVLTAKAEVILNYEDSFFHSPSVTIPTPSIIRLKKWVKTIYRDVPLSKRNVFLRDKYTCGYTGQKIHNQADLTIDHIIPLSKGGTHSWENVVTAKKNINDLKKDYILGQDIEVAHLPIPRVGRPHFLLMLSRRVRNYSKDWEQYLITKGS